MTDARHSSTPVFTDAETHAPLPDCKVCTVTVPTLCPRCGLNVWDGLHRNGQRRCYMDEVPQ